MPYKLSQKESDRIAALPAEDRLRRFIETVQAHGEVWTLAVGDGVMVLGDEDEDSSFIVVWDHPAFAEAWFAETDLDEADVVAIPVDHWAEDVLPALEEDEVGVRVSPTPADTGLQLSAGDVRAAMDRRGG